MFLHMHYKIQMQSDRGNYEIHLTVASDTTVADFIAVCGTVGAKPVLIVLPEGAQMPQQLMTSTWNLGTLDDAKMRAVEQAHALALAGFDVVRAKIESGAHMIGTPQTTEEAATRPEHQYYEFHAKICVATVDLSDLDICVAAVGGHLSHNAFRKTETDQEIRFVTWRFHATGRSDAINATKQGMAHLKREGFDILSFQSEYAWVDTNVKCDSGWIDGLSPLLPQK